MLDQVPHADAVFSLAKLTVFFQWNLHHLNPYRKYGLVRVKYGFSIRVQYRFEKPEVFAETQGFPRNTTGYYGLSTGLEQTRTFPHHIW